MAQDAERELKMALQKIQLSVNGKAVEKEVEARKNLADFLRHDLSLPELTLVASTVSVGVARSYTTASRFVPA
jgi:hypothetical protein